MQDSFNYYKSEPKKSVVKTSTEKIQCIEITKIKQKIYDYTVEKYKRNMSYSQKKDFFFFFGQLVSF